MAMKRSLPDLLELQIPNRDERAGFGTDLSWRRPLGVHYVKQASPSRFGVLSVSSGSCP